MGVGVLRARLSGVDVLILGGTEFLGWHMAHAYAAAGHRVTLFNRGRRRARTPPEIKVLIGDRRGDLAELTGRTWDVAVDTSGYLPRIVRNAAAALRRWVGSYVFVSTISAFPTPNAQTREDSETCALTDEQEADAELVEPPARSVAGGGYGEAYGALKARCEAIVQGLVPYRSVILRPGFIIGPEDYSARFSYWIERALRGGEAVAPGRPERPLRLVDARDISEWLVRVTEYGRHGVFNVTGANGRTMGELIGACARLRSSTAWRWVSEEALVSAGIRPFVDLPYWLPAADNGVLEVPNDAAIAAGLAFRSFADSAGDTCQWRLTLPMDLRGTGGLPPDKERAVLNETVSQREQRRQA